MWVQTSVYIISVEHDLMWAETKVPKKMLNSNFYVKSAWKVAFRMLHVCLIYPVEAKESKIPTVSDRRSKCIMHSFKDPKFNKCLGHTCSFAYFLS